ncbi:MAG: Azurin [Opitutaceae bacterium]|nr:Azurin [Opitutaceae bacterium]|tara:strand:+ start:1605 stop:2057 length:453 start_codon:yes stop_codon:yes gene_type:complete
MKIKLAVILMSLFGLTSVSSVALAGTTIELSANDTMQFDSKSFEVPAGEEITLVFTNKGALPKAAMGHNVVILKPGSNVMGFGAGAVAAAATEYVPQSGSLAEQVVANTRLLGPNETDTIKFKLDAPGEYSFICSFPGHYALMKGIITAK